MLDVETVGTELEDNVELVAVVEVDDGFTAQEQLSMPFLIFLA